jgi:hypothetical protein
MPTMAVPMMPTLMTMRASQVEGDNLLMARLDGTSSTT